MNRYSYVGNDPANFVDPTGLVECFAVVRLTILITSGKPDQIIDQRVLFIYCIGGKGDVPDKLNLGDTEWRGTKITHSVRRATQEEMMARPDIVKRAAYEECMNEKYAELKQKFRPELERIMYRGLRNAILAAGTGASFLNRSLGLLNGALLGAGVTYPSWLDGVEDFEREKLGPAREAAKAECRKKAGLTK